MELSTIASGDCSMCADSVCPHKNKRMRIENNSSMNIEHWTLRLSSIKHKWFCMSNVHCGFVFVIKWNIWNAHVQSYIYLYRCLKFELNIRAWHEFKMRIFVLCAWQKSKSILKSHWSSDDKRIFISQIKLLVHLLFTFSRFHGQPMLSGNWTFIVWSIAIHNCEVIEKQ